MRNENRHSRLLHVPDLPDDFPHRVIARARFEQRQRRNRLRLAAAVLTASLVVAIPFFSAPIKHAIEDHGPRGSTVSVQPGREGRSFEAGSYQLSSATAPAGIGDYLMPNAAPLGNFAASYTASWQYDPSWPYRD